MKFLKLFLSLFVVAKSLTKDIGIYKFVKLSDYSSLVLPENIQHLLSIENDKEVMVICDSNNEIANFKGELEEDGCYICCAAQDLAKLMTVEDKKHIYIRKFNDQLQVWIIENL